jgi:hypothetical protein
MRITHLDYLLYARQLFLGRELTRNRERRSSQNSFKANFRECPFHALWCIRARERTGFWARTSANRKNAKFAVLKFSEVRPNGHYEGPLFSSSSLRTSLFLSQSSYFWPSGMVAPSRKLVCRSNSSLVIPTTPLRSAPRKSASISSA